MRRLAAIVHAHRHALGILAVVFATAPLGVVTRPLRVGDETREAAIADRMARTGDYLQTSLAGRRVVEKPPFFYASVASSIRLGGAATPVSTRLPSIVFSALTLLAVGFAGSLLFSRRAGVLAAMVLSTTYLFAVNAHDCVIDVSLTAFVSAGLLAFVAASRRKGHPTFDAGFGVAAAGALLAKGLVGPMLLAALTLPFWLLAPARRRLRDSIRPAALLWPAGALVVWLGAVAFSGGPAAIGETLWNQQAGRFLGFRGEEYSHHRAPLWFYAAALPGMLFPWVLTLPAAIRRGIRERIREAGRPALALLLGIGLGALLLSAAGTKRTIYFLPLVPPAALLVASCLDIRMTKRTRASWGLWAQFAVIAAGAVSVPLIPAVADGHVTAREAVLVVMAAGPCLALALYARRSARRLVGVSIGIALTSLLVLDRFSLPQIGVDGPTRDFFLRVERRLTGTDRVYAWTMNEDVLGRACLELSREPIVEPDARHLRSRLAADGAFLLAEDREVARAGSLAAMPLELVEHGRAGGRPIGLYRFRNPAVPAPSVVLAVQAATPAPDRLRRPLWRTRSRRAPEANRCFLCGTVGVSEEWPDALDPDASFEDDPDEEEPETLEAPAGYRLPQILFEVAGSPDEEDDPLSSTVVDRPATDLRRTSEEAVS